MFKDGTEAVGESKIAVDRKTIDRVFVRNQENNDEPKAARKVVSYHLKQSEDKKEPASGDWREGVKMKKC